MTDNTIQFEGVKMGLKQSKDGYVLTLAVHPDELPDAMMRDFVGSRYVVVMVRLGDDEQPMTRENEFPGDHAVKMAGILVATQSSGTGYTPRSGSWRRTRRLVLSGSTPILVSSPARSSRPIKRRVNYLIG